MNILRLALLSLAAVIALSLGIHWLVEASRMEEGAPAPATLVDAKHHLTDEATAELRREVEAKLTESPDYARFFDRLKLVLPSEYEALIDEFMKRAQAGAVVTNIDFLMSEAVRSLRLSRGMMAAKASAPALVHIFEVQSSVLHALAAKEPRLCVDFLYGGASDAFFSFSSEHRPLVADMAIAGLEAIEDGQTQKIERPPPNDADFELLENALKIRKLNETEIEALLDGKSPYPPIPDTRMCDVGQIYLETLATLPEPVKLRIYGLAVELMARS
ncbi:MAG: hypothetical protein ACLPID_14190 [Beijerinckiaceae bacterium]